jgi:hypothetical protein
MYAWALFILFAALLTTSYTIMHCHLIHTFFFA